MTKFCISLSAALSILGCLASAASAAGEGPPRLPPEAFTACDGKASGDACKVKLGDHTIEGTCVTHPSEQRLFCMPSRALPFTS
jgi:hypothetical protein